VRKTPLKHKLGAAFAGVATLAAYGLAGSPAASAAQSPFTSHRIKVNPDIVHVSNNPNAAQFTCQGRPIDGSKGIVCYDPSQIQQAYGVKPLLDKGKDGTGRTIVIVDAYQNPYIAADLATFD
jgi:subtilase family serine protease